MKTYLDHTIDLGLELLTHINTNNPANNEQAYSKQRARA